MAIRIYKYTVSERGERGKFTIELPKDSMLLQANLQYGKVVVWAEVFDKELEMVSRTFHVLWTGDEVPEGLIYLNTFKEMGSSLIYHVYEEI